MNRIAQRIVQVAFFALCIVLTATGKAQLFMGLFALSVFASFLFGRIYCGWICPIHTAMSGVSWLKKKLRIKSIKIPAVLTRLWVRLLALGLFVALFIFTMASGKRLPVLPALAGIGAALAFLFPEELWHRYICPYGTIMLFPASKAKHSMRIDPGLCNNCGACEQACPAKAVSKNHNNRAILKGDCLICMRCSEKCKQKAIGYK